MVATISSDDGSQVADPEVIFRGVPFAEEADGLRDELRDVVNVPPSLSSVLFAAKESSAC